MVTVHEVCEATSEVEDALARLVPQLSDSAPPVSRSDLESIVASDSTHLLVARGDDGVILGTMTLVVFRIPTGMRAWIEDVIVDGSARGQGVGASLNRAALHLAAGMGVRSVDLTSRPSREAANRLYRKLGFTLRETNVYRFAGGSR